ncbi:hypothetical protein E2C01_099316 [Portunus trituberculatus]|uniref:Uncharacterized protein n=1 Tax=Portunus trituberculatus TaxID=210409 RepID=A0A5B7KF40_PORTR|nr:hypothetical protein [Portunus trituberculatus]
MRQLTFLLSRWRSVHTPLMWCIPSSSL